MVRLNRALALAAVALVAACSGTSEEIPPAARDAGVRDARPTGADSGTASDGGAADGGERDAGVCECNTTRSACDEVDGVACACDPLCQQPVCQPSDYPTVVDRVVTPPPAPTGVITGWRATNGPLGGEPRVMIRTDDDAFLVGTTRGSNGLFRSVDGESWSHIRIDVDPGDFGFSCLARDTSGRLVGGKSRDIWRSADEGATWEPSPAPGPCVVINPITGSMFVVNRVDNGAGLSRSIDGGEVWMAANEGIAYADETAMRYGVAFVAFTPAGVGFAVANGDVYRTLDDGLSWTLVSGLPTEVDVAKVDVVPSSGAVIVSVDAWGRMPVAGLYRSDDAGETWERVLFDDRFTNGALSHDPSGGLYFALVNTDWVYLSNDGGRTWSMTCWPDRGVRGVDDDGRLLVGGDALYRIGADGAWTSILANTHVVALHAAPNETLWAATTWGGLFRSDDEGGSWQPVATPENVWAVAAHPSGRLFVGLDGTESLLVSDDDGATWSVSRIGVPKHASPAQDGSRFAFRGASEVFAVFRGGASGVWYSPDLGDTWSRILDARYVGGVVAMADGSVWAAYSNNRAPWQGGIVRTSTAGGGFEILYESADHGVTALLVGEDGLVYAGRSDGAIMTSSTGATWTVVATDLALPFPDERPDDRDGYPGVRDLAQDAAGIFYAASYGGLHLSDDGGASWRPVTTGLTDTDPRAVVIAPNGVPYVGTWGSGVFRGTD